MPTRRNKQQRQKKPASYLPFLELPLEIRQLIYELCYLGPHPSTSLEPFAEPHTEPVIELKSKKRRFNDKTTQPAASRKLNTKCTLPQSHLSLGSICQQVRNEYFPIFARHHIFTMIDPLVFANDYMAYNPPHRYSSIRHLAIQWGEPQPTCRCEGRAGPACRLCLAKSPMVSRDITNLVKMVNNYPELFNNLESIRFSASNRYKYQLHLRQSIDVMMRQAMVLVEKIDRARKHNMGTADEQKFILAVQDSDGRSSIDIQIGILAVPNTIWDLVADGSLMARSKPGDTPDKGINWTNRDEFITAVEDGILSPWTFGQEYREQDRDEWKRDCQRINTQQKHKKNWKVVFKTMALSRHWDRIR